MSKCKTSYLNGWEARLPVTSPIEEMLIRLHSGGGITLKINILLQEPLGDLLLKVKKHWAGDLAIHTSPEHYKSSK